jgi:AraC-like DNA-binding protein
MNQLFGKASGEKESHRFGDAIARSFGLTNSTIMSTESLRGSQIALNRLSIGTAQFGMSRNVQPEDTFVLALYLTDLPHHQLWSHGRPVIRQGYAAKSMRIVNLRDEYAALVSHAHESLVFHIPRQALNELTDDAGAKRISELGCMPGTFDPVIAGLGEALLPSFERPGEASTLFVEHLTLAAGIHIARTYGAMQIPRPSTKGGLSPRQLQDAKNLLSIDLREDFSLAQVAGALNLSRSYFARAFKASTGLTPHQWRQRCRVYLAEDLLARDALELTEIATSCGFADQSHLTKVFKRVTGESPARWRRRQFS